MSERNSGTFTKHDGGPNSNDINLSEDSLSQSSSTNDPLRNSNRTLKPGILNKENNGPQSDNDTFTTAVSSSQSSNTSNSNERYLRDSRSHATYVELPDMETGMDSVMHSVYEDANNSGSSNSANYTGNSVYQDKGSSKSFSKSLDPKSAEDSNGTSSTSGVSDVLTVDITNTRLVDSPSAMDSSILEDNPNTSRRRTNTEISRSASLIIPQQENSDQFNDYRFNVGNSSLSSDSTPSLIDMPHLPIEGYKNTCSPSTEGVTYSSQKTKALAEKPFEKRPFHLSKNSDCAISKIPQSSSPTLGSIHNSIGALLLSGHGNVSPKKELPQGKGKLVPYFKDMADKLEAQKAQREHATATNNMLRSLSFQSEKQRPKSYINTITSTKMRLTGEAKTSENKHTKRANVVQLAKGDQEKKTFDIEKGQDNRYHDELCPGSIAIIMILLSFLAPPFWMLIAAGYADHAFGKIEWKYKVASAVLALILCIGAIIGVAVGLGYGLTH